MADDRTVANENNMDVNGVENGLNNGMENGSDSFEDDGSLRNFVTRNFQDQKDSEASEQMSKEDEERRNRFFQRAVSESQRMSAEVERSQQRHGELQAELGADNLHAWTMEHASKVTVTLPAPGPAQQNPPIPECPEPMDSDAFGRN